MADQANPDLEPQAHHGIDRLTRFASEDLARTVNRRAFLRRAGSSAFALIAGLAAGRLFAPRAAGAAPGPLRLQPIQHPVCTPPGPFCNLDGNVYSPNGCHGAHCFQHLYSGQLLQCRLYYQYFPLGCWTNVVDGGYWTCCDCACGTPHLTSCGCAQFSGSPAPLPSRPGA